MVTLKELEKKINVHDLKKNIIKYAPSAVAGIVAAKTIHDISKNQEFRNKLSILKQYIVKRAPISEKVVGEVFNKRYQIQKFFATDLVGTTGVAIDLLTKEKVLIKEIPVKNSAEINSELNVTKLRKNDYTLHFVTQKYFHNNLYIVYNYDSNYIVLNSANKFIAGVLAFNLLKGLDYLHSHNVAHNNINFKNVLVNSNSQIKYINFEASCYKMCNTDVTASDLHFLSPEKANRLQKMANGSFRYQYPFKLAKAGDVWALGVLIYTVITGGYPPENYNNIPISREPLLTTAIKMMEPDPSKRISTSTALREIKINKFQRLFTF